MTHAQLAQHRAEWLPWSCLGESPGRPDSVYVVVADPAVFCCREHSLPGNMSAPTTTTVGRLTAPSGSLLRADGCAGRQSHGSRY